MKNRVSRFVLLAGVMTLTSMYEFHADARGLIPDRPSVEVRLEALRALRATATAAERSAAGLPQSPFGVAQQAPVATPPAVQPYQPKPPVFAATPTPAPVATPIPVRPQPNTGVPVAVTPPAPVTTARTPVQQPVTPPPSLPSSPKPVMVPPSQQVVNSNEPVKPATKAETPKTVAKPEVKETAQNQPQSTPAPKEEKKAEKKQPPVVIPPVQDEPELEIIEESASEAVPALDSSLEDIVSDKQLESLPPSDVTPAEEVTEFTLESLPDAPPTDVPLEMPDMSELVPEKPETSAKEAAEKDEAKAPSQKTSSSLELPPLPESNFSGIDRKEETEEKVSDISSPSPKEEEEADRHTLSVESVDKALKAPDEEKPLLETAKLDETPVQDLPEELVLPDEDDLIEDTSDAEPAISDAEESEAELPPPLADEVTDSDNEEASPAISSLPDSDDDRKAEQVNPVSPAATSSVEEKKSGGMFPNLGKAFSSLFGGENKKTDAPAPAITEPAPLSDEPDALPPVADTDDDNSSALPDVDNAIPPADEELPELPDFNEDRESSGSASDEGLPELPDFGEEQTASTDESDSELPPLPFGGDKESNGNIPAPVPAVTASEDMPAMPYLKEEEEQKVASVDTSSDAELPPLEGIDFTGENSDVKLSVQFSQSETEVPLAFQQPLINLSKELKADPESSIKVIAYASGTEDQKSIARRISLARALAVRAFLIDLGVDNVRISVQALGNEVKSDSTERADIVILPKG